MIYLDTHVVVWLYAGETDRFSADARQLIEANELLISPVVLLELEYLYEIGRISVGALAITEDLTQRIGLRLCQKDFSAVVRQALSLQWTRDPFDRLLVAQAALADSLLLSKDQIIHANYANARW